MGRTGSGKTTLLECICGLRSVQSGCIQLSGVNVTDMHPADRNIGYVPQDGALFTTMTVRENVAFALELRGWSRKQQEDRVAELAGFLGIAPLLNRKPKRLSGGEKQRVALGRALAFRPSILCLDEPLSALDDSTRESMYELLRDVRQRTSVTVLHVTHNESEARALADVLLKLDAGEVTSTSLNDGEDVAV